MGELASHTLDGQTCFQTVIRIAWVPRGRSTLTYRTGDIVCQRTTGEEAMTSRKMDGNENPESGAYRY